MHELFGEKQKHFADKMKCKGCRVKLKGVTKFKTCVDNGIKMWF